MTNQIDGKAVERLAKALSETGHNYASSIEAPAMLRALLSERDALQAQVEGMRKEYGKLLDLSQQQTWKTTELAYKLETALAREGAVAMEVREKIASMFSHPKAKMVADRIRSMRLPTDAAAALAQREDEVWNEAIEAAASANRLARKGIRALKRSEKDSAND